MKRAILHNASALLICFVLLFAAGGARAAGKPAVLSAVEERVRNELLQTLSPDVELMSLRLVRGGDVLVNERIYSIAGLSVNGYSGRNRITYLVSLIDEKGRTESITVEASYDLLKEVLVASKRLPAGTLLSGDDFYSVRQRGSRLPAGAVTERSEVEGKMLKTALGQGVVIKADHLTSQLTVKRGQKVEVVVEGASVVVATKGMLRSDAVIGGGARVMCDISKKEINGILISPQTVKVKL